MTTLVVDGNNILMRSLRAAQGGGMDLTNDAGVPTAPLLLFVNSLTRYIRQVKPTKLAVCWDGGHSTYRHEIFDGYKAERRTVEKDEIETSCFALAKHFLGLAHIQQSEVAGVEADDLIAHLWHRSWISPMVILSGDKDLLQLVTDDCTQIRPDPQAEDEVWTSERVVEKYGCAPGHWGLVLALMGDPGDGVPGLHRVGPKTACKVLASVGWSIDRLISDGPDRYREEADLIRRNVRLVELRNNAAPLPTPIADPTPFVPVEPGHACWPGLESFLSDLRFGSTLRRLSDGTLWR